MADAIQQRHHHDRHLARERVERRLPDYGNPLEALSGAEVYQRYRFRPETIMYIVGIVQDDIVRPTKRSCALPPVIMVLAALRFLACGSFYQVVSDTIRVSKSSIWKAVHEVTGRLARQDVVRRFVRLGDDLNQVNATKAKFHQLAGKWTQLIPCHS